PPTDFRLLFPPPPAVRPLGHVPEVFRGVPFVCHGPGFRAGEAIASGLMHDGILADLVRVLERFVYSRAAHLLVVTDGARANLVAKGASPTKVSVLPHWYPSEMVSDHDPQHLREEGRRALEADGEFVVTFAGNLGLLQGLSTVLDAAAELRGR